MTAPLSGLRPLPIPAVSGGAPRPRWPMTRPNASSTEATRVRQSDGDANTGTLRGEGQEEGGVDRRNRQPSWRAVRLSRVAGHPGLSQGWRGDPQAVQLGRRRQAPGASPGPPSLPKRAGPDSPGKPRDNHNSQQLIDCLAHGKPRGLVLRLDIKASQPLVRATFSIPVIRSVKHTGASA